MSKIHLVTTFFWPVSGDVEDYPYNIARTLKESGRDYEVLTTDVWPDGRKVEIKGKDEFRGIKIKRFPTRANLTWFVKLWFPKFSAGENDIIHVCEGFRHPHFLYSFFKRGKAKFFISPFYPLHPKKGLQKLYTKLIDATLSRFIVKRADCCFAETSQEREWLESLGAKRVIILPNSLPDEAFKKGNRKRFRNKYRIKEDDKVIFSLGRQVPIKNFEEVIKILSDLNKNNENKENVKFVIGGEETDYTKELKKLVEEISLKDKVIFTGFLNSEQKRDAFAGCDVFVLSSIRESLGTVVLEAMASNKAVIASDTGGLRDVVPAVDDDFCLYRQGDLEELKAKILRILNDKKFSKKISDLGRKKAGKFKFRIMKEMYLKSLEA